MDAVDFAAAPPVGSLFDVFARQAALGRDRVALVSPRQGLWTYGWLEHAALAVAWTLLARGRREGKPVALLLPPGPSRVAAVLGTLAAGRTYVPLDPAYP